MELSMNAEQQAALVAAQAALAEAVACAAAAIDAMEPGGADAVLGALQSGLGTVVAQLEVLPAGPCALELHVNGKRYPLGLLVHRPAPTEH